MWGDLRAGLTGVKDIEKFNRKLIIGKVSPRELATLFDDLETIGSLNDATIVDGQMYYRIHSRVRTAEIFPLCAAEMMATLTSVFDMEKCSQIDDVGVERLSALSNRRYFFH